MTTTLITRVDKRSPLINSEINQNWVNIENEVNSVSDVMEQLRSIDN